jgi:eukaryotic-like serine/threonine-protein kinase
MSTVPRNAKEIFLQAIEETAEEERAAFLDRACAGDAAMRARVEELLAAHQVDSFLERPAAPLGATREPGKPVEASNSATSPPRAGAEAAGAHIGPYKLLQLIGEGGMGAVWMAEQQRPVRRQVALKVIKAGMDSAQVVARFEAERQALALMDHPNIAKVLDGGTTDGGRPFFVMELVRGIPITKYCDDQRLAPPRRLELYVQVCEAIQHAHQKGIIHRDIKPSNVLVAPYDGRPVVKVIDFGVAKATGQQLTERTMFTEFGAVIGTVEYMSPEQSELNNQDIDTRSDIYSLGVLLYELLTGTPPLTRRQLQQAAFTEMLRMIREEDPPRPSMRLSESKQTLPSVAALRRTDPAKLPKLLRGELDCIAMKGLEKDRNRRYETANALARDIQCYLSDEPVLAQPPTVGYRVKKFVRRHKGPVVAASLLALAVVAGMAGTTWGLARASRALAREADQRTLAEQERDAKDQARKAAVREADEKEQARAAAEVQRHAAEEARQEAERALYFNRINLAQQYWVGDNLPQSRRMLDACPVERRGWEWRYFDRLYHGDLLTLPSGGHSTTCLQHSQDGKRLAAFSNNGETGVRIWNLTDNQLLADIHRVQGRAAFRACALSSDGETVALSEASGAVTLWEAGTGKLIRELARLPQSMTSLSFSPDGKWLAAARDDIGDGDELLAFTKPPRNEDLVVWNVASGEEAFHPKGYGFGVLFSPDGSRLVTLKRDTAFRIWQPRHDEFVALFDTADWSEIAPGKLGMAHAPDVKRGVGSGFSFNGDGTRLALAGWDRQRSVGFMRIINPATGKEVFSFNPGKRVGEIALSRDGALLATTEWLGSPSIDLWDLKVRRRVRTVRGHTRPITAMTFAPDGRLASSSSDKTVKFWDPAASSQIARVSPTIFGSAFHEAVFSAGTELIAFPNMLSRAITALDLAKNGAEHKLSGPEGRTVALAFSRDRSRLASGGSRGEVKVWDVNRWDEVCTYRGHDGAIEAVAISPDGQVAASVHQPKELTLAIQSGRRPLPEISVDIHVWDASTGAKRFKLSAGSNVAMHKLAFSPDGKTLMSASGHVIKFWDVETGSQLRELDRTEIKRGPYAGLTFSPSGKLLVTTGRGIAQLRDAMTARTLVTIEGHGLRLEHGLAFSPDETRLATAAGRELKLWYVATGQEIVTLPRSDLSDSGSATIIALGWTSDGHRLRAGLIDGSVVEWRDE